MRHHAVELKVAMGRVVHDERETTESIKPTIVLCGLIDLLLATLSIMGRFQGLT